MTELGKQTWPEAEQLLGPETVVILPVGSTEAHGPHLPLDTDVTIARAQALRAAERLGQEGVGAVVLPPLCYGLTNYAEGFAGTISIRPGTLWNLVEDVVVSLREQGIRRVVLSNGHLEPAHVKILRDLCLDHPEVGSGSLHLLFPDNTRRRWAGTLGEEFQSGDCHAGRYESSIVLAADGGSVREDALRGLAPKEVGLVEKMLGGAADFQAVGADEAWCGDPAAATAEEGEALIEQLGQIVAATALEEWPELAR